MNDSGTATVAGRFGTQPFDKAFPNLLWGARLLPLLAGFYMLMAGISFLSASTSTYHEGLILFLGGSMVMLSALVAWRWHLIGGLSILATIFALGLVSVLDRQAMVELLPSIAMFIGGVLHLIYWRKYRWRDVL